MAYIEYSCPRWPTGLIRCSMILVLCIGGILDLGYFVGFWVPNGGNAACLGLVFLWELFYGVFAN